MKEANTTRIESEESLLHNVNEATHAATERVDQADNTMD